MLFCLGVCYMATPRRLLSSLVLHLGKTASCGRIWRAFSGTRVEELPAAAVAVQISVWSWPLRAEFVFKTGVTDSAAPPHSFEC
ncbi:hypothetical protein DHEL01_v203642 [Diaporthe helianthi]|uniref:Uncharacterized protein n=1 Tax=Diaporthe helianthi TaxID=158607 RepID=A0A2P5I628_DIAHE|nr:hypothetical protein DHEL01_v203642 [Diaporthe helianthi]